MVISISALKGFLLEEALAKLLENSGYALITKDVLDNPELYPEFVSQGNGLNIKGRGGTHQADVLGQFPIAVPFNYPIRLFLEAKFRNSRTGIDVVRSGVGILTDLNANYQTIDLSGDELLVQRYNYQYAIFSTSGFSENAIKLAVAYKITLIDLSGNEYRDLLEGIDLAAHELRELLEHGSYSLADVREFIRSELFAVYPEDLIYNISPLRNALNPFWSGLMDYGDLYLASINSPFSILLKPDFPQDFRYFIKESRKSTFHVNIYWQNQNQNLWRIRLIEGNDQEFTFYLPKLLNDYIFNNSNRSDVALNALNAKEQFLGNVIFYMKNEEKFIIFKYRRIQSY
ncbi:restriction endonuclease [Bacillus cereus]|uniref:Restriction endonuclease n=1 Tax=Bacillus cereus TaxID=1396 RepID=A0AB34D3V5_BACCE|nr:MULTISPECIES: hypothetical protein [Bacillus cereus group]ANN33062.1 hypothetical protein A9498_16680 [Bacillus thuringiensis serovar coreanensis]TKV46347.1 hypothetical protein C1I58_24655 [Bacillus sp. PIC28]KAB2496836.1 restriction endonuclease [Bacillus cereus]MCU5022413.1 restriction endonuclease [Bacillus cereus]MDA1972455.1 hypothetical protein [Bacillus cereus]